MPASRTYEWRAPVASARARILVLALGLAVLAGCSTREEVLPYPDLTSAIEPSPRDGAMTRAEKDAAISELRAEAREQAENGL